MLLMEFFTVSSFDFNGCDFIDTLKTLLPELILFFSIYISNRSGSFKAKSSKK